MDVPDPVPLGRPLQRGNETAHAAARLPIRKPRYLSRWSPEWALAAGRGKNRRRSRGFKARRGWSRQFCLPNHCFRFRARRTCLSGAAGEARLLTRGAAKEVHAGAAGLVVCSARRRGNRRRPVTPFYFDLRGRRPRPRGSLGSRPAATEEQPGQQRAPQETFHRITSRINKRTRERRPPFVGPVRRVPSRPDFQNAELSTTWPSCQPAA
jgi:hypothetical protein